MCRHRLWNFHSTWVKIPQLMMTHTSERLFYGKGAFIWLKSVLYYGIIHSNITKMFTPTQIRSFPRKFLAIRWAEWLHDLQYNFKVPETEMFHAKVPLVSICLALILVQSRGCQHKMAGRLLRCTLGNLTDKVGNVVNGLSKTVQNPITKALCDLRTVNNDSSLWSLY